MINCSRVMSEYENRDVIGRVVAPPARPRVVPGPVAAAEHLATHDVGADSLDGVLDDRGVSGAFAALDAVLPTPAVRGEHPLVQPQAADADRVVDTLIGPGDEPIERDRDMTGHASHEDLRG
jgi:hypothetical protein